MSMIFKSFKLFKFSDTKSLFLSTIQVPIIVILEKKNLSYVGPNSTKLINNASLQFFISLLLAIKIIIKFKHTYLI